MATIAEIKELALHAARGTAPANYSVQNVNDALRDELKTLAGDVYSFMKNRYDIYSIMVETIDEIVPKRVIDAIGIFAEVKVVGNNEKAAFKTRLGRNRAKKFLTQVGLNGLYESFRLDHETFTIGVKAIGGAVTVDFERMMDGTENLAEFMNILAEAQEDAIYVEVQAALMAAADSMPSTNKIVGNYNAEDLQKLVNVVKTYGGAATIFASPEFVSAMGADIVAPAGSNISGVYSPKDIQDIAENGRVRMFRGTPIVELRQSFLDENNDKVMIHPQFAYILPSGREKVVKVLLEGATQMYDHVNPDQSVEIHTYKKVGVGILAFNNWGVYKNTQISADNWYDNRLGLDVAKV